MRVRAALVVLWASASIAVAGSARAQRTTRASVDSSGLEASRASGNASISADGRYVAFRSEAPNLVPGDANRGADVFVHDRQTGETSLVSVSSEGVQGNDTGDWWGLGPSISAEGRFVAFNSTANNLVPGDTNGVTDIFVHDRATGETSRVSVSSTGCQARYGGYDPVISADGRYVGFHSESPDLVSGDTNDRADVFCHDRQTGETSRVSVDSAGAEGGGASQHPSISADGRYVAFQSGATRLVPGDTNGTWDVFVHDRRTRETSRVSVSSAGIEGNSGSSFPSISFGGRFVAFSSVDTNLVPNDTNGVPDIFVHDRQTGETSRVSVSSAGGQSFGRSYDPSISADGRYVAFSSDGALVPGYSGFVHHVFRHDRRTGETTLVSVSTTGSPGSLKSQLPTISADGRFVAFSSDSDNLVASDTNFRADVFVRDTIGCGAGNVNGGVGEPADVLFVNDSAGGRERTVRLFTHEPITVFMSAPPSAEGLAPFALFVWRFVPIPGAPSFALPFGLGETCLPTPLTGGSPSPRVVWNNTGSPLLGAPTLPSSPAPSIVVRHPRGLGRPAKAFFQGVIRDRAAPNGRAAVTNGVTIEIR